MSPFGNKSPSPTGHSRQRWWTICSAYRNTYAARHFHFSEDGLAATQAPTHRIFCGHKLGLPLGGNQRAGTCALLPRKKKKRKKHHCNTCLMLTSPRSPALQPSHAAGHCQFTSPCLHSHQPLTQWSCLSSLSTSTPGTAQQGLFDVPSSWYAVPNPALPVCNSQGGEVTAPASRTTAPSPLPWVRRGTAARTCWQKLCSRTPPSRHTRCSWPRRSPRCDLEGLLVCVKSVRGTRVARLGKPHTGQGRELPPSHLL